MTSFTKLAQEKFEEKLALTRKTKLVKNIEKKIEEKLPFEIKEENLKAIAKNVIVRAKQIRESLKSDPIGTVKNYKTLLDVQTLAPKNATAKKVKKGSKGKVTTPKKALKKALSNTQKKSKSSTRAKKAIH